METSSGNFWWLCKLKRILLLVLSAGSIVLVFSVGACFPVLLAPPHTLSSIKVVTVIVTSVSPPPSMVPGIQELLKKYL